MDKKIIAVQTPPEEQQSAFSIYGYLDFFNGLIIDGNRYFDSHTTPEYDRIRERFSDEKTILRALRFLTGETYKTRTIRGICQSDWQRVFYPERMECSIHQIEKDYFNTGTEFLVNDEYIVYCYGDTLEEMRKEIADSAGVDPENVVLKMITGQETQIIYTWEEM